MVNFISKYWIAILIGIILLNYLGFYFIKESIWISDALEHVESDETIKKLKRKDFFYEIFTYFIITIDFIVIALAIYLFTSKILSFAKKKKI